MDFLQIIERNFNSKEFTASHWKYIHEIFTIQSLNKEYTGHTSKFRIKHIEYLFDNNGYEEDKVYFILEYVKAQLECYGMDLNALDDVEDKDVHKAILLQALEHIDTLIKTQHKESDSCYLKSLFVEKVFAFNIKYPECSINIEENMHLLDYLKTILKGDQSVSYWFQLRFCKMVCKLNRSDFENELLKFYLRDKPLRQLSSDSVSIYK